MENEKIVLGIDIQTGQAVQSFKSIKTEVRALEQALASGKLNGQAFTQAASRAAQLKESMQDAKDTIAAFNPEQKFTAFAGVLQGVANGFSVVQGAMALMGGENEDLQKMMLKTQAAIAIATGLNGLMGMGDAFKNLGGVIVKMIPAVKSFGVAMWTAISGGVLTALILIATYWEEIAKTLGLAGESMEEYNKRLDENIELNKKAQGGFKKLIDFRLSLIKDVREREIAELKEKQRRDRAELDREYIQSAQYNDLKKSQEEMFAKQLVDLREKYRQEDLKKAADARAKREEDERKAATEMARVEEKRNKNNEEQANIKKQIEEDEAEFQKELDAKREENRLKKQQETIAANRDLIEQRRLIAEKQAADAIALEKQKVATVSGILGDLKTAVGENAEANKAVSAAQAAIATYEGANNAFTSGSKINVVFGFVAAAAAVSAGLMNVRKILSTPIPKGGQSASIPSGSTPTAPQIPTNSSSTTLTGNQPILTRQLNVADSKVYVLESDITGKQKKVNGIIKKATIR